MDTRRLPVTMHRMAVSMFALMLVALSAQLRADGTIEAMDRKRLYSYAGSVGLRSRPLQRAS